MAGRRRLDDKEEDESQNEEHVSTKHYQPSIADADDEEAQLERLAAEGRLGTDAEYTAAENDTIEHFTDEKKAHHAATHHDFNHWDGENGSHTTRKAKQMHFASAYDDYFDADVDSSMGSVNPESANEFASVLSKVRARRTLLGQPAPLEFDADQVMYEIHTGNDADATIDGEDDVVVLPQRRSKNTTSGDACAAYENDSDDCDEDEDENEDDQCNPDGNAVHDEEEQDDEDDSEADAEDEDRQERREAEKYRRVNQHVDDKAEMKDCDSENEEADDDQSGEEDECEDREECEGIKQTEQALSENPGRTDHGDSRPVTAVSQKSNESDLQGQMFTIDMNVQSSAKEGEIAKQQQNANEQVRVMNEEDESGSEDEPAEYEDEDVKEWRKQQLRHTFANDREGGNDQLEEEAEMSDDGGHTDDEDDDNQLDPRARAALKARDEEVLSEVAAADVTKETDAAKEKRAELHAQWAEEAEQKEMDQLMEAYRSGFKNQRKRRRQGAIDEGDEEEWQRTRRAEDESETDDDDDDGNGGTDRIAPEPVELGHDDDNDEVEDKENDVAKTRFGRSATEECKRIALEGADFSLLNRIKHSGWSGQWQQQQRERNSSQTREGGWFTRITAYDTRTGGSATVGKAYFQAVPKVCFHQMTCFHANTVPSLEWISFTPRCMHNCRRHTSLIIVVIVQCWEKSRMQLIAQRMRNASTTVSMVVALQRRSDQSLSSVFGESKVHVQLHVSGLVTRVKQQRSLSVD